MNAAISDLRSKLIRNVSLWGVIFIVVALLPPFNLFQDRQAGMLQTHLLLELFSIIVSLLVATVAWYSFDSDSRDEAGLLCGGFLAVAALDLVHALSYDGMPQLINGNSTPKAIHFWLAGRSVAALTLFLLAAGQHHVLSRRGWLIAFSLLVGTAFYVGMFHLDWLPVTFIAGYGVTTFKSIFEYGLFVANIAAAALFLHRSNESNADRFYPLAAACLVMAMGELVFAHYRAPADFLNIFGHAFKVVSYALIFKALFITGMRRPYQRLQQAEESLRESREQLRVLSDNLPDSYVYQYTREGEGQPRLLFISAGVERLNGFTSAAVMADPSLLFSRLDPAQNDERKRAEDKSAAELSDFSMDLRAQHTNGEWRWFQARSRPRREANGRVVWDGVLTDITERKRLDDELQTSRARIAGIIDSAMDGIITIDKDKRIVVFNAAAERIFGRSASEMLGQSLDALIPERFRQNHAAMVGRFGSNGATNRPMGRFGAIFGLRANGEEFPADASISQVVAGGQQLFTVTLRDVSERYTAELAREQLEAQLRQAQKMDALGTLAGGVAHDFNNILATIDGCAELINQELPDDHAAITVLKELRRANRRGRDLVRRILTFSQRQQPQRSTLDIRPVIDETVHLLRATLPARVSLNVEYAPGLPGVIADRTELEQVIVNLCTNAWQAMDEKDGHIRILVDQLEINGFSLPATAELKPGTYIRLAISDDGAGMDSATASRIFEPFFSTKESGKGIGLGLSVVHGIVVGSGGAISVQSQPGHGTTFTVHLPAGPLPATSVQAAAVLPERGNGQRVLYVDDEEALVYLAERLLGKLGYRISGFTEPAEALAAFRAAPDDFDVMVVDYNMPGASGLELAAQILQLRPHFPIIMASGYVPDDLRAQALAIGIREVLYKPDTAQELAHVIHRQLVEQAAAMPRN